MNTKNSLLLSALVILGTTLGVSQTQAEMGRAPAGATDFYLSVFGGYVYQDAPDVNAYTTAMGTVRHALAVQDGGFVGVDLGFILGQDVVPFGLDNARIETSFSTNIFDDDKDSQPAAVITSVDGLINAVSVPASATQEREVFDGSIALKGEIGRSEVVDLTAALEFFVRHSEDKSAHSVGGAFASRNAKVDGWYYGAMVALQPEFQLGNGLSFATDFAAGLYVLDGSGRFSDNFGITQAVSDSRTDVGFRGRLGGALKAAVASGITASLFGVVDYWSDTGFADMPIGAAPVRPARVGLDGLTEAKAGARLTIALGGD